MFTTSHLELYLSDVTFRVDGKGDDDKRLVDLSFQLQPFTKALARELGVQDHLFDGEGKPLGDLRRVEFRLKPAAQVMRFGPPDLDSPSLQIDSATVAGFAARINAEGPVYTLTFRATFDYPRPEDINYLVLGLNRKHFITFEDASPGLDFGEDEAETADAD